MCKCPSQDYTSNLADKITVPIVIAACFYFHICVASTTKICKLY